MIKPKRKRRPNSLRLPHHDYSQMGAYFVTICTKHRLMIFGGVVKEQMIKNDAGKIVQQCWEDLPNHYDCTLGEFVVMPNHIHGIVILGQEEQLSGDRVGAGLRPTPTVGLPEIVRALKSFSARRINEQQRSPGRTIWQRGFYDHIIRDDESLGNITEYIRYNPIKWKEDRNNPTNLKKP
jgi:REP element-mobilizing transposase RayT